jgi:hypothetical protein
MTTASRVEVRLAPHGNKCMGRWRGSDRTGGGFIGPRAAPGQQVALATGGAGRSRHSLPSSGSAIAAHRPCVISWTVASMSSGEWLHPFKFADDGRSR